MKYLEFIYLKNISKIHRFKLLFLNFISIKMCPSLFNIFQRIIFFTHVYQNDMKKKQVYTFSMHITFNLL